MAHETNPDGLGMTVHLMEGIECLGSVLRGHLFHGGSGGWLWVPDRPDTPATRLIVPLRGGLTVQLDGRDQELGPGLPLVVPWRGDMPAVSMPRQAVYAVLDIRQKPGTSWQRTSCFIPQFPTYSQNQNQGHATWNLLYHDQAPGVNRLMCRVFQPGGQLWLPANRHTDMLLIGLGGKFGAGCRTNQATYGLLLNTYECLYIPNGVSCRLELPAEETSGAILQFVLAAAA